MDGHLAPCSFGYPTSPTNPKTPLRVRSLVAELRVILVDPLYQGNVGHVARSMMNFGVTDLAFVKGTKITDEGRDRAVHAQKVLDDAPRHATLTEAAAGCDLLVGFTARMTGQESKYRRNPMDLRQWAPEAAKQPGRIGLVFGREDRGLTNEDADRCDILVCIPTHEMYRSMNLAHAVTVALYSVYAEARTELVKEYTPAPKEDLDRLAARFALLLEAGDYPPHKRAATVTMFQRLVGRAAPTAWEVTTLLGAFKDVLYHLGLRRDRPQNELPITERTLDTTMDGGAIQAFLSEIAKEMEDNSEPGS